MNDVNAIVERLRAEWRTPQTATHAGQRVPVPLVCRFESPATEGNLEIAGSSESPPPQSLLDFWRSGNGALLFEDEEYGQWGLRIFSAFQAPAETAKFAAGRPDDFRTGDLVLGEFLGDSDLLLIRCDRSHVDYGSILVALPLDDRASWDLVAPTLEAFLALYAGAHGDKFWRNSPNHFADGADAVR